MKFLTPLIILGLAIGIFFWYVDPMYHDVQMLRAQGDQYQAALVRSQQSVAKRDALLTKYNSLSTDNINRIQSAIPDTVNPIHLIIDMNGLAARYGTTLQDMKVTDTSENTTNTALVNDGKTYEPAQMTFSISLTYPNFISFLNDLERNLRLTDVISVTFTPNDSGLYMYNFTINTYWLK